MRNDLEAKLTEKTREVEQVTLHSIMAIAKTIEAKDTYTRGHSDRVARCSIEIAKRLGWDEKRLTDLHYFALLHDIGKIGVPDEILNKPMPISDDEYAILKKHSSIGGDILRNIRTIKNLYCGALYHHERYDGNGYPTGLSGENIPIEARIIAIIANITLKT